MVHWARLEGVKRNCARLSAHMRMDLDESMDLDIHWSAKSCKRSEVGREDHSGD